MGNFEIRNKVSESGLINFDLSKLFPEGEKKALDIKDFLREGLVLVEKDFRIAVNQISTEEYRDSFVYLFCSTNAVIPLWAYFLLTSKLVEFAKKVVHGDREKLEEIIYLEAIEQYDFSSLEGKRVLVKGCSNREIPTSVYVLLVSKLRYVVKSLFFGEACSSVPIFKN